MLAGDGNGRRHVGIVLSRGDRLSGCLSLGILLGGEHEVHVELERRFLLTSRMPLKTGQSLSYYYKERRQKTSFRV